MWAYASPGPITPKVPVANDDGWRSKRDHATVLPYRKRSTAARPRANPPHPLPFYYRDHFICSCHSAGALGYRYVGALLESVLDPVSMEAAKTVQDWRHTSQSHSADRLPFRGSLHKTDGHHRIPGFAPTPTLLFLVLTTYQLTPENNASQDR